MSVLGHWVWLSRVQGLSPRTLSVLIEHLGSPLEIYNASSKSLGDVPGITRDEISALSDKGMAETEAIIAACQRLGVSILTLQDAAYPERLAAIPNPPVVLYLRGKLPPLDSCPALAVVGSRNASPYGLSAAKKLSFELASAGVVIVSGMAQGCDAAAHSGALDAGFSTIAVLGCGPDVCYPAQNRALFNDIPRTGAVVCEYPPGAKPNASHFPQRNRIISGLSNGVLVAEASADSGALITASLALEQGREVYAVPGNIDYPLSAGANSLIKQGAKLVTSARDILNDLVPIYGEYFKAFCGGNFPFPSGADIYTSGPAAANAPAVKLYKPPADGGGNGNINEKNGQNLEMKILTLLRNGDMYQDDIITALGGKPGEVGSALTMLEIEGKITGKPGNIFGLA